MHYSEDDNADTPLLPATSPEAGLNTYSIRLKPWPKRHPRLIVALVAALSFSVALAVIARHGRKEIDASALSHIPTPNSTRIGPDVDEWPDRPNLVDDPVVAARLSVDALFARQSFTIKQAMARYSLKTGQPPPPNYDKWFEFAREKSCLIDDYDQIHRDFKPFYELAQNDPHFFQRRLDIAFDMMKDNPKDMSNIEIKDGEVLMPEVHANAYWDTWPITIGQFASHLPDMTFIMNGHDQPRVAFNCREPGARSKALDLVEQNPFSESPHPTSDWFYKLPGCDIPLSPEGFFASANEDSAFFTSTAKTEFTIDLYPMLSMAKIGPCFADILFPIEYYYDRSWWSGKVAYPNNIEWKDKKSQIYWRGSSTGGQVFGSNYRDFPRFKLVELARQHSDLVNAAITSFSDELCGSECDREAIIEEYNITGQGAPREDEYAYKYLLDVDGNAFSGRYLGLLRSGSLVFKATVFEEYFNDWLRPFERYIPVLPDLSDLLEQLEWAMSHDDEAQLIQERGREISQRLMTDAQNDCYFFLVLLEWARLQEISRNATLHEQDS
ncbi:glycosyl transferase family 90-domain-containing protein [Mycena albidolilacea]|uniref:Glycosyl transferase family 90-domain-containing protein n=1 Tax=Mycena albidolilacea TaxID=1033008 RepID=A0AAD7EFB2_9AGAR|nr:glycosyl transferase family 90-domain-containing protein [Mycena albidolilacea]